MKTLVVSDIHSNLEALEVVLEEPHDNLLFLGDLIDYGPNPKECLDRLKQCNILGIVKGNHDHAAAFNVSDRCSPEFFEMSSQTREFTMTRLSRNELDFLGGLPTSANVNVDGLNVFMAHASPQDHMYKYFTDEISDKELQAEVGGVSADIVLVGHSHLPFAKRSGKMLVANPGSVGQPRVAFANTCFAVIEDGEVRLKQKSYDFKKTIAKIEKMPLTEDVKSGLIALLANH